MVSISIYTAPDCGMCAAAKRAMTKHGIPFQEVNTANNPAALAYVRDDLGYSSAPVTALTYRDGRVHSWGGFDLDQIRDLAHVLQEEGPGLDQPTTLPGLSPHHNGPEVAGAA